LHLGILLEDLRIALAEQLRYPLVGYASCAQPSGIRGAQVVNPKVGNLCPSQSFRPNGLELLEMSGRIQIAWKKIRSFARNRHLIRESLDGEQREGNFGRAVWSLRIRYPDHRILQIHLVLSHRDQFLVDTQPG